MSARIPPELPGYGRPDRTNWQWELDARPSPDPPPLRISL